MFTRRALVVVVVLVLVLGAVALAQRGGPGGGPGGPGGPPPGMAMGTVADINENQIVVKPFRGDNRTMAITNETGIVRRDAGTRDDVAADQLIALSGTLNAEGQLAASDVNVGDGALLVGAAPGGGRGGFFRGRQAVGKITAVQGDEVTIELKATLPGDVRINKVTKVQVADVLPGEQVMAFGNVDNQGNTTAQLIQVGAQLFGRGPGGGGPRGGGPPGGPPGGG